MVGASVLLATLLDVVLVDRHTWAWSSQQSCVVKQNKSHWHGAAWIIRVDKQKREYVVLDRVRNAKNIKDMSKSAGQRCGKFTGCMRAVHSDTTLGEYHLDYVWRLLDSRQPDLTPYPSTSHVYAPGRSLRCHHSRGWRKKVCLHPRLKHNSIRMDRPM